MKIGVIADTHAQHIDELPVSLVNMLVKMDLVVHLGDYDSKEMVEEFKSLGNFKGITGNHDSHDIRALLPDSDILEINGKTIGLVHGHGCVLPAGFQKGLKAKFKGKKIDIILYGHTHITRNELIGDTLYFNPGSAIGRFPAYRCSYGILDIGDSITGEVLPIPQSYSLKPSHARTIAGKFAPQRLIYYIAALW